MGAVRVPAPCEGGAPHASLSPVGGRSPGTLGTPTLSLYLLEADFRVPAVPGGPRPCFRSCMETSWLAVRDRAAPWNTEGPSRRPASSPPGGTLASSALGGPSGSCSPSRCPRRGCEASGPGPQWPQARTCLLDGDGEAVVVGAALGLHRHVAGRVTCRTGARQVRGRGGAHPSRHTALASRCRCSREHGGRLPRHGWGGRGHHVPAASLQCWGSARWLAAGLGTGHFLEPRVTVEHPNECVAAGQ